MRITIVSTQDIRGGGGYMAAYRLHRGLQQIGLTSRMIVQHKKSDDPTVHKASNARSIVSKVVSPARRRLDGMPWHLYPLRQKDKAFSPAWLPGTISHHPRLLDADIVIRPKVGNLHWSEFSHARSLVEEGERAAREHLEEIRNAIPGITKWFTMKRLLHRIAKSVRNP